MTQEHLMGGLSIIVFSGLLLFITISTIKKRFPATATRPFNSATEIISYYQASISVLSNKLWILLLPLGFVLSEYIVKIPIFLYQRPDISTSSVTMSDLAHRFSGKISLKGAVISLLHTPNMLDYGYNSSISKNVIFFSFFLICALTFKAGSKKLQQFASASNMKNVFYFEKILKASLAILILIVTIFAALSLFSSRNMEILFYIFLGLSIALIGLLSLSLFSIIEAFVLFSVKCVINNEEFVFDKLVNMSLKIFKHLFFLNIILFCIGSIPSLLILPFTLASFFSLEQSVPALFSILPHVSIGYSYLYSMFMALTFCVPFALVSCELNVIESFKANFIFIKQHLLKYLIFVGVGVVVLYLPSILQDVLMLFVIPFSILSLIIEIFIVSLKLLLAVVFYIAMFKFFLDNSALKEASQMAI